MTFENVKKTFVFTHFFVIFMGFLRPLDFDFACFMWRCAG